MRTHAWNSTAKSLPFWFSGLQDSSPTVQRWEDTWDRPGVPGWGKPTVRGRKFKGEKEERIKKSELLNNTATVVCVIWEGTILQLFITLGALPCLVLPARRGREWHCVIRLLLLSCNTNKLLWRREPQHKVKHAFALLHLCKTYRYQSRCEWTLNKPNG